VKGITNFVSANSEFHKSSNQALVKMTRVRIPPFSTSIHDFCLNEKFLHRDTSFHLRKMFPPCSGSRKKLGFSLLKSPWPIVMIKLSLIKQTLHTWFKFSPFCRQNKRRPPPGRGPRLGPPTTATPFPPFSLSPSLLKNQGQRCTNEYIDKIIYPG
jgi:hypothetical protein